VGRPRFAPALHIRFAQFSLQVESDDGDGRNRSVKMVTEDRFRRRTYAVHGDAQSIFVSLLCAAHHNVGRGLPAPQFAFAAKVILDERERFFQFAIDSY
jgi:hypothetical protein